MGPWLPPHVINTQFWLRDHPNQDSRALINQIGSLGIYQFSITVPADLKMGIQLIVQQLRRSESKCQWLRGEPRTTPKTMTGN